jgi:hypothetical protein
VVILIGDPFSLSIVNQSPTIPKASAAVPTVLKIEIVDYERNFRMKFYSDRINVYSLR